MIVDNDAEDADSHAPHPGIRETGRTDAASRWLPMKETPVRLVRLPDGGAGLVRGRLHDPAPGPAEGLPATLALTHGAGGDLDTPGLVTLARGLAARGIRVLRFNLPAAEAGRKHPDRAAAATRAIGAVVSWAAETLPGPLFVGGRSFGGRMASLLLADSEAAARRQVAGAVFLAYPLKPPGRPEVPPERMEHLGRIAAPMLFVSGGRDPFAPPALLDPVVAAAGAEARWIAGADHGFRVPKAILSASGRGMADVHAEIAREVAAFVARCDLGPVGARGAGVSGGRRPRTFRG